MRKPKKWRKFRAGCVIVAAGMAATYWTLRAVQASFDLYGTVGL
ncbi:hypothetical protein [Streptomyces chartreusis]